MELKEYVGEKIKYYRKLNKMTQEQLADLLNTTKQTISKYEKGHRKANQDILFALCDIFNVSIDDFFPNLNNQDESLSDLIATYTTLHHPRQLKVYHFAKEQLAQQQSEGELQEEKTTYTSIITGRQSAAGSAIYVDDSEATYDVLPASMIPNGANEVVEITGDSMEPLIKKGSKVYLRHQPEVENGEIAIVRIEDDGVTCKYFYHEGAQVRLKSANEAYDDIVVDASQVTVLGKVLM